MNGSALIIQQVPHEGEGLIRPVLRGRGVRAEKVRAYRGEAVPPCIPPGVPLIVLGGPMGACEEDRYPFLTDELRLIESALRAGNPVLGICLGSQLMARAAGAGVYPGGTKEIGWYPLRLTPEGRRDRLFLGLPEEMEVFQWHGDTFDLPRGAALLATSELYPNQLVRLAPRAYAMQFHLEVTGEMIDEWLEVNAEELEGVRDGIDPAVIEEMTPRCAPLLRRYGTAVFSRFMRL